MTTVKSKTVKAVNNSSLVNLTFDDKSKVSTL